MALLKNEQRMHWYVMRDLKRPNAKLPAYKQLSDEHLEVFTPAMAVKVEKWQTNP